MQKMWKDEKHSTEIPYEPEAVLEQGTKGYDRCKTVADFRLQKNCKMEQDWRMQSYTSYPGNEEAGTGMPRNPQGCEVALFRHRMCG